MTHEQNLKRLTFIWPFNIHASRIPELFPIGLGYLIENVKDIVEVSLLDCALHRLYPESPEFIEQLRALQPDMVGISWWSNNTKTVEMTLRTLKTHFPHIQVIVGGPHPTAYGEQLIQRDDIDYVFYGEAEMGLTKLLKKIKRRGSVDTPDLY
jgi:radical SAM superfamily enzyme YgiQ (UPF0313 family)